MYLFHKDITEPVLLKIQSISDDRGFLVPFTDDIDHSLFHRAYIVENYGRAVIRGLHYHKEEIKIFTVASGAAKFMTLKLPPDVADRNNENEIKDYLKSNSGVLKSWVISSRHHAVLGIPVFHANGWISLEDNTVLVALSNLRYEKALKDDLRINPYVIGEDPWKILGR